MVVCLCRGVSEKRVRRAVEAGAQTRRDVTRACGAGGACGGCHGMIREILCERVRGDGEAMLGISASRAKDVESSAIASAS